MTSEAVDIDVELVRKLVRARFPQWSDLGIAPVPDSGWDNRMFRLGREMVVRLPGSAGYAVGNEREQRWLPVIAPALTQPIRLPLAVGEPAFGYPWRWSVYRWLAGETALPGRIGSMVEFARELAAFLRSLHTIPDTGGPPAGVESFHRGGALAAYDGDIRRAIAALRSQMDAETMTAVWDRALASHWAAPPVWVHGDVGVGNLLVADGRLCGVIDFGQCCVGDPACDLVPAWTLFDGESRAVFRGALAMDADTWARGRGWALWKAAIVAAGMCTTNAWEGTRSQTTIDQVIADFLRDRR